MPSFYHRAVAKAVRAPGDFRGKSELEFWRLGRERYERGRGWSSSWEETGCRKQAGGQASALRRHYRLRDRGHMM